MKSLKVLYLVDGEDDSIYAYFPLEVFNAAGMGTAYAHVGQHSACSREYASSCKEASEELSRDLHMELSRIYEGYDLEVLNDWKLAESLCFSGDMIELDTDTISKDMLNCLRSIGGAGQQQGNVEDFLRKYKVEIDEELARKVLGGYGAWSDEELSDHVANVERLLWLIGCEITERENDEGEWDNFIVMD